MGESLILQKDYIQFTGAYQEKLEWNGKMKDLCTFNIISPCYCSITDAKTDNDNFCLLKNFRIDREFNMYQIFRYSICIQSKDFYDSDGNKFAVEFYYSYDCHIQIN